MEDWESEARKKANLQKSYKKKKTGKTNFDKEALTLWSLIVRQRAGGCELCGKDSDYDRFGRMVKGADAHHILSRTRYLFRYNLNNGICLCKGCHMYNKEHSPHHDSYSSEGFMVKMATEAHLSHRYLWYEDNKHDKRQPTITQEEQYYKLLDIYIDMLDGIQTKPVEPE